MKSLRDLPPEKKHLFLSVALAVLGALLAWIYLYSQEQKLLHKGETVRVLAASHTLPAFARLNKRDLQYIEMPRAYVPRAAVSQADELLGKRTLVPFSQGELLLFNKVGEEGVTLASAVPEGYRAVSLPMDEVSGLLGLLEPGDRVDLFSIQNDGVPRVGVLLQQVQVLAVGARTSRDKEEEASKRQATVTLALPESEAALVLLAASRSALQLALRAPGDERPLSQARALPADMDRRLAQAPLRNEAPSAPAVPSRSQESHEEFIPRKR